MQSQYRASAVIIIIINEYFDTVLTDESDEADQSDDIEVKDDAEQLDAAAGQG